MIKNLGKFKQWTGEKFGGAKVTLQTEDFQRLEQETEHRREGYEKVIEAVETVESYLLKRKTSPEDGKTKLMPLEALGACMYHYGAVFPEGSALGIALSDLGHTETRIAALQEALANEIRMGYMATLDNGLQEYKDYDSLRKKLASRRLDYDSKLNRLNKAKKEKPELEQEMQAARIKYEDTEHDLIQKMAYIQEFENEHRDSLYRMLEAQYTYHSQAKELLESLKSSWGKGSETDPVDFMGKVIPRRSSNASYHSVSADNMTNYAQSISAPHSVKMSRANSTETFSSAAMSYQNSTVDTPPRREHTLSPETPHTQAQNQEYEHLRKALFDFNGQNEDEISFKTGDIIEVLDEIDVGWWLGEVHSKRGIFPVNYTEEYNPNSQPLPPLPSNNSTSQVPPVRPAAEQTNSSNAVYRTDMHPTDQAQVQRSTPEVNSVVYTQSNPRIVDVAFNSNMTPSPPPPPAIATSASTTAVPVVSDADIANSIRRPPPPPVTSSSPAVTTMRSGSLSRKGSTAIRAPPPPPALRTNHLEVASSTPSPSNHRASPVIMDSPHHHFMEEPPSLTAPLPPLPNDTTPSPPQSNKPCTECDCLDYIENVFKKGYCNNCFHKHAT